MLGRRLLQGRKRHLSRTHRELERNFVGHGRIAASTHTEQSYRWRDVYLHFHLLGRRPYPNATARHWCWALSSNLDRELGWHCMDDCELAQLERDRAKRTCRDHVHLEFRLLGRRLPLSWSLF